MSDKYEPCYGCGNQDVCHFLMVLSEKNHRDNVTITLCDDCHNHKLDDIKDDLAWQELAKSVLNE